MPLCLCFAAPLPSGTTRSSAVPSLCVPLDALPSLCVAVPSLSVAWLSRCIALLCDQLHASALPRAALHCLCRAAPRRAKQCHAYLCFASAWPIAATHCHCFAGHCFSAHFRFRARPGFAAAWRRPSVLFQSIPLLCRSSSARRYAFPLHGSGLPCYRSALHCSTLPLRPDRGDAFRCCSTALRSLPCFSIAWLILPSDAYAVPCRDVRVLAYSLLCRAGSRSAVPLQGHSTLCPCFATLSDSEPMRRIPSLARRSHT